MIDADPQPIRQAVDHEADAAHGNLRHAAIDQEGAQRVAYDVEQRLALPQVEAALAPAITDVGPGGGVQLQLAAIA
nr:hypothetical protein [Pseudomonas flavescens]